MPNPKIQKVSQIFDYDHLLIQYCVSLWYNFLDINLGN